MGATTARLPVARGAVTWAFWRGLVALVLAAPLWVAAGQTPFESAVFGDLRARAIGPAAMSGRVAAIAAVPADPLTIYVGAASGGVWRSKDGGTTFEPIFDEHTQSIGAIAVDPRNPKIVWVGTGESWTRNSVSIGTGVYKSTDGGDSWTSVGLTDTERIARIVIDPSDGDRVFVCATGHLWDGNDERGVYRTVDGGKTWTRVHFVDRDTGCSDLAIDPGEPRVLYAGMWQFRRWPWFFRSGGPGSGLYRSTDGGTTWTELTAGLPSGEKGRIAVAVAPSRPSVVYAVVEAAKTALYRSDDLGATWSEVNSSENVQARPFYFATLAVDPSDHRRVYKPGLNLTVSTDGGRTFTSPFTNVFGATVHSDHHALWIDPRNPYRLLLGTDGGLYISEDRGVRWRMVRSLPIAQFYEVSYDLEWPYNVYGGLQDNGTWMGPSRALGGIRNRDWRNVGFGDGFHAFVDPKDPDFVYVEYQGGNLLRYQKSTQETKEIKPYASAGETLRFNWNTPIHVSRRNPGTLYVGAQFLLRSTDRGESWERISPDLTTDDPAKQRQQESGGLTRDNSSAENHTTIYTISESPVDPRVIWVGTDDGNLQLTRDAGRTWANVVGNVTGVPPGTWVSHVEASPHAAGTAWVTFDGHMTGDVRSYAFRTDDYGATWTSLANEPVEGYAHVIRQDPINPDLVFLGTEFGLFVSIDGGARWARFTGGLPRRVPVRDLAIHEREHDLIIATHGRGIYILDDLTPLRALTPAALDSDFVLLPSRPAVMALTSQLQEYPGDDEFVGENPPDAAWIVYYQRRRHMFGDLKVEVVDSAGRVVATIPGGKVRGLNRVPWPMRLPPPKMPPATTLSRAFVGPRVPEGAFRFRVTKGDRGYEGEVVLRPDPRSPHSAEDRAVQQRTAMRLYDLLERLTYLADAASDLRDQARARATSAGGTSGLGRRLVATSDALERFRAELVSTREGQITGEERLREQLGNLFAAVAGYDGRPTQSQLQRVETLGAALEAAERRFWDLTGPSLAALNSALRRAGLDSLLVLDRSRWGERR